MKYDNVSQHYVIEEDAPPRPRGVAIAAEAAAAARRRSDALAAAGERLMAAPAVPGARPINVGQTHGIAKDSFFRSFPRLLPSWVQITSLPSFELIIFLLLQMGLLEVGNELDLYNGRDPWRLAREAGVRIPSDPQADEE